MQNMIISHIEKRTISMANKGKKSKSIIMRVSEQNKLKIQKLADNENKTVSEYILDVALKQQNVKNNSCVKPSSVG